MSSKCDGCGSNFMAGTKKIEYKGHQWHEKCFHCKVCGTKVKYFKRKFQILTLSNVGWKQILHYSQ